MGLHHFAGGVQRLVHADKNAQTEGFGACSRAHGAVDVHRAVGARVARSAHGGRRDDGLFARVQKVEEVARFLKRIGAVRDDDARDVVAREEFLDLYVQIPHVLRGHARGGDVGELDEFKRSDFAQAGHGGREVFARAGGDQALACLVVLHGDRAAGGDNHDFLVDHVCKSSSRKFFSIAGIARIVLFARRAALCLS